MNLEKPITIAYFTCRFDPKIEWFFYSLNRELKGNWNNVNIIIIDYYLQRDPAVRAQEFKKLYTAFTDKVIHVSPKPSVWQGNYKQTANEYFAASNARNTAFAYCETDYIVCIDDLTVIKEGWLNTVLWGQQNNFVIYGAYAKANELVCQLDGSYTFKQETLSKGLDSRFNNSHAANTTKPIRVAGSWLFGCSFGLPIDLVLQVDGFDESCDGQGAEDYDFGIRLGRLTSEIYYCKEMFTYENDELHAYGDNQTFKRISKLITKESSLKAYVGQMSDHAKLKQVMASKSAIPYHQTSLRKLRELINCNKSFPLPTVTTDWRDGQLLSEM